MPSIAQQDYIVIKTSQKRYFQDDAEAMSKIAGAISRNTLFDCLIENIDDAAVTYYFRPVGYMPEDKIFYYYDAANGGMKGMDIPYSESQYQGLAAIQHAIDEKYGLMQNLPSLKYDGEDNSLNVAVSAQLNVYVCVDGKKIITTVVEDKIKALTLSETGPGEDTPFVNITWEDAQKLIGVAIL